MASVCDSPARHASCPMLRLQIDPTTIQRMNRVSKLYFLLPIWAIFGWLLLLFQKGTAPLASIGISLFIFLTFIGTFMGGFAAVAKREYSRRVAVIAVISTAVIIIQDFTLVYFNIGTVANFSRPLTRLDALYVALGNFTTAGTGNISPISEEARAWVICQYSIDVALLTGLVSFLLWRVSATP
jgi:hypothetical protein